MLLSFVGTAVFGQASDEVQTVPTLFLRGLDMASVDMWDLSTGQPKYVMRWGEMSLPDEFPSDCLLDDLDSDNAGCTTSFDAVVRTFETTTEAMNAISSNSNLGLSAGVTSVAGSLNTAADRVSTQSSAGMSSGAISQVTAMNGCVNLNTRCDVRGSETLEIAPELLDAIQRQVDMDFLDPTGADHFAMEAWRTSVINRFGTHVVTRTYHGAMIKRTSYSDSNSREVANEARRSFCANISGTIPQSVINGAMAAITGGDSESETPTEPENPTPDNLQGGGETGDVAPSPPEVIEDNEHITEIVDHEEVAPREIDWDPSQKEDWLNHPKPERYTGVQDLYMQGLKMKKTQTGAAGGRRRTEEESPAPPTSDNSGGDGVDVGVNGCTASEMRDSAAFSNTDRNSNCVAVGGGGNGALAYRVCQDAPATEDMSAFLGGGGTKDSNTVIDFDLEPLNEFYMRLGYEGRSSGGRDVLDSFRKAIEYHLCVSKGDPWDWEIAYNEQNRRNEGTCVCNKSCGDPLTTGRGGFVDEETCSCVCLGNDKHGFRGPHCLESYGQCQPGVGTYNRRREEELTRRIFGRNARAPGDPPISDPTEEQLGGSNSRACAADGVCENSFWNSYQCEVHENCCITPFAGACCPFGYRCGHQPVYGEGNPVEGCSGRRCNACMPPHDISDIIYTDHIPEAIFSKINEFEVVYPHDASNPNLARSVEREPQSYTTVDYKPARNFIPESHEDFRPGHPYKGKEPTRLERIAKGIEELLHGREEDRN